MYNWYSVLGIDVTVCIFATNGAMEWNITQRILPRFQTVNAQYYVRTESSEWFHEFSQNTTMKIYRLGSSNVLTSFFIAFP